MRESFAYLGAALAGQGDQPPDNPHPLAFESCEPRARRARLGLRAHPVKARRDARFLAHAGKLCELARCVHVVGNGKNPRIERAPVGDACGDFAEQR